MAGLPSGAGFPPAGICDLARPHLTVLPNVSNICLANNSTHISLGSRKLSRLVSEKETGFTAAHEKYLGDLAIKVVEHFLPLFVGTYSAAPYRLEFRDFHPERALGFLPHELDYTHLRMIWRRWKKKAKLTVLSQPLTPFGPQWIDDLISALFGLKGDFVQDFRLIDYFASLMSTDQCPGLDGALGNSERLKADLAELGIFDTHLAPYFLYRMREAAKMGFSGFEGRYYSLFHSLTEDVGAAASLQNLITALAYKYILKKEVTHRHIPDDPETESERRQIFFGTAIGIPTIYVRKDTPNLFMMKILERVKKSRLSHRYGGCIRIPIVEYRKALISLIEEDAADLIDLMDLGETVKDLKERIADPDKMSVAGRLTQGILCEAGASSPMTLSGTEFNTAAEHFYRNTLRKRHIEEALELLDRNFQQLDTLAGREDLPYREAMRDILGEWGASDFLRSAKRDILEEKATFETLRKLIHLTLAAVHSSHGQDSTYMEYRY